MAGPGDSVGRGQGREAPGPAVRGQQRAALGLQEKLRGVGSRAAFGVGSLLARVQAPGWKQQGEGVVGGARGEGDPWGRGRGLLDSRPSATPQGQGRPTARRRL